MLSSFVYDWSFAPLKRGDFEEGPVSPKPPAYKGKGKSNGKLKGKSSVRSLPSSSAAVDTPAKKKTSFNGSDNQCMLDIDRNFKLSSHRYYI